MDQLKIPGSTGAVIFQRKAHKSSSKSRGVTISRVLLFCAVVGCIRNDGCSRTSIGPRRPPLLDAADDLIIAPGKSIGLRHRALRVP